MCSSMEVDKKIEVNIQAQIKAISKASLLELGERNRGLVILYEWWYVQDR